MENVEKSYFDGGLFQQLGWTILGILITTITFGICYPWAFCMLYGWEAKHTVINGKRLLFKGSAIGLFGTWIKCILFTIITIGIYGFWVPIKIKKWKTKHTIFLDSDEPVKEKVINTDSINSVQLNNINPVIIITSILSILGLILSYTPITFPSYIRIIPILTIFSCSFMLTFGIVPSLIGFLTILLTDIIGIIKLILGNYYDNIDLEIGFLFAHILTVGIYFLIKKFIIDKSNNKSVITIISAIMTFFSFFIKYSLEMLFCSCLSHYVKIDFIYVFSGARLVWVIIPTILVIIYYLVTYKKDSNQKK